MDYLSSFSGNFFAVLVYYFKVGDVGFGVVVGNAVFINCTDDLTIVFFYSIFQTSAGFSYVRKIAIFTYIFTHWPPSKTHLKLKEISHTPHFHLS